MRLSPGLFTHNYSAGYTSENVGPLVGSARRSHAMSCVSSITLFVTMAALRVSYLTSPPSFPSVLVPAVGGTSTTCFRNEPAGALARMFKQLPRHNYSKARSVDRATVCRKQNRQVAISYRQRRPYQSLRNPIPLELFSAVGTRNFGGSTAIKSHFSPLWPRGRGNPQKASSGNKLLSCARQVFGFTQSFAHPRFREISGTSRSPFSRHYCRLHRK